VSGLKWVRIIAVCGYIAACGCSGGSGGPRDADVQKVRDALPKGVPPEALLRMSSVDEEPQESASPPK
jgi:hypothetical protein